MEIQKVAFVLMDTLLLMMLVFQHVKTHKFSTQLQENANVKMDLSKMEIHVYLLAH
jgi:hypothetical protein